MWCCCHPCSKFQLLRSCTHELLHFFDSLEPLWHSCISKQAESFPSVRIVNTPTAICIIHLPKSLRTRFKTKKGKNETASALENPQLTPPLTFSFLLPVSKAASRIRFIFNLLIFRGVMASETVSGSAGYKKCRHKRSRYSKISLKAKLIFFRKVIH